MKIFVVLAFFCSSLPLISGQAGSGVEILALKSATQGEDEDVLNLKIPWQQFIGLQGGLESKAEDRRVEEKLEQERASLLRPAVEKLQKEAEGSRKVEEKLEKERASLIRPAAEKIPNEADKAGDQRLEQKLELERASLIRPVVEQIKKEAGKGDQRLEQKLEKERVSLVRPAAEKLHKEAEGSRKVEEKLEKERASLIRPAVETIQKEAAKGADRRLEAELEKERASLIRPLIEKIQEEAIEADQGLEEELVEERVALVRPAAEQVQKEAAEFETVTLTMPSTSTTARPVKFETPKLERSSTTVFPSTVRPHEIERITTKKLMKTIPWQRITRLPMTSTVTPVSFRELIEAARKREKEREKLGVRPNETQPIVAGTNVDRVLEEKLKKARTSLARPAVEDVEKEVGPWELPELPTKTTVQGAGGKRPEMLAKSTTTEFPSTTLLPGEAMAREIGEKMRQQAEKLEVTAPLGVSLGAMEGAQKEGAKLEPGQFLTTTPVGAKEGVERVPSGAELPGQLTRAADEKLKEEAEKFEIFSPLGMSLAVMEGAQKEGARLEPGQILTKTPSAEKEAVHEKYLVSTGAELPQQLTRAADEKLKKEAENLDLVPLGMPFDSTGGAGMTRGEIMREPPGFEMTMLGDQPMLAPGGGNLEWAGGENEIIEEQPAQAPVSFGKVLTEIEALPQEQELPPLPPQFSMFPTAGPTRVLPALYFENEIPNEAIESLAAEAADEALGVGPGRVIPAETIPSVFRLQGPQAYQGLPMAGAGYRSVPYGGATAYYPQGYQTGLPLSQRSRSAGQIATGSFMTGADAVRSFFQGMASGVQGRRYKRKHPSTFT